MALHPAPTSNQSIFDDAEVAVLLAVLSANPVAHEHSAARVAARLRRWE
jgi:hypothetical protein